jgi:hypothetical protein
MVDTVIPGGVTQMKYWFGLVFVLSLIACAGSPRSASHDLVFREAPPGSPRNSLFVRARIVELDREILSHAGRQSRFRGVGDIAVRAFGMPMLLPREVVQRVLALQDELDRLLVEYVDAGGRVWCERPVVHAGGRITIEERRFVGLPRHADVQRRTRCYLADEVYPGSRRPIEPYLTLEYRLGEVNDLTTGTYLIERYPLEPLPPVPAPTPLPLVCDESGVWCQVVESR